MKTRTIVDGVEKSRSTALWRSGRAADIPSVWSANHPPHQNLYTKFFLSHLNRYDGLFSIPSIVVLIQIVIFSLLGLANAWASLDFEQEVLHIPETHEVAKYLWQVRNNPADFSLDIQMMKIGTEPALSLTIKINSPAAETIKAAQFFIVDKKFKRVVQIFTPRRQGDVFSFNFTPGNKGTYRLQAVLRTEKGWLNIGHNLKIPAADRNTASPTLPEQGYQIKIKKIPQKIYADHVASLVFEINYNGIPVNNLEMINGAELQLVAWGTSFFRRFAEFTYATSRQNLGGPEAAVSVVFKKNGLHEVFVTFKHLGKIQTIKTELMVYLEKSAATEKIINPAPAED